MLIVTPGGSTSNSYVTIDEAEALLLDELIDLTSWTAATADDKVRALITAARLMDHSINWYGSPYTYDQSLGHPRYIVHYGRIYTNPPNIYPDVKIAQSLLALWLIAQRDAGQTLGGVTSGSVSSEALSSLKVGPISIGFESGSSSSSSAPVIGTALPDHIWMRLRPFGTRIGGVSVPLVRT